MRVNESNIQATRQAHVAHIPNSEKNAHNPPKAMEARADEQTKIGRHIKVHGHDTFTGDSFPGFLPAGIDGLDAIYEELWDAEDAGQAKPTFVNADAHILNYNYQTGRGDDAYLMDIPPDGQLEMNVVISPSAHDSDEKYHEYAKTNVYFVHAQYTSKKTGKTVYLQNDGKFSPNQPPSTVAGYTPKDQVDKMFSFDVQDKVDGEYASISPTFNIDLNDVAGDLWVGGFAKFSAGVGGYVDARKTSIHLPPDYK